MACICAGGFVPHVLVPDDWRRRLTDAGHDALVARWGSLDAVPLESRPGAVRRVAACLCPAGRPKAHAGVCTGIEELLTETELRDLYGGEVPVIRETHYPNVLMDCGVPFDWAKRTLASFGAHVAGDKMAEKLALYASNWIKTKLGERSDLVLYGPNGTCKSGLAVAILRACAEQREAIYFWSAPRLMLEWRALFAEKPRETEREFFARLLAPDVLVLDELTGTKATEFIEQAITMIVDERQKLRRATILTLNIPGGTAEIDEQGYLAALLGPTLFDRLGERGQFWPMRGKSKRSAWKPPKPAKTVTGGG